MCFSLLSGTGNGASTTTGKPKCIRIQVRTIGIQCYQTLLYVFLFAYWRIAIGQLTNIRAYSRSVNHIWRKQDKKKLSFSVVFERNICICIQTGNDRHNPTNVSAVHICEILTRMFPFEPIAVSYPLGSQWTSNYLERRIRRINIGLAFIGQAIYIWHNCVQLIRWTCRP